MRPAALLLSGVNATLALLVLLGLARRGRLGASRVLPAYLLVLALERVPVWLWPERFYTWPYWLATELLEATLRFALALDLLRLIFRNLPAGRARSGEAVLLVVSCSLFPIAAAAGHLGFGDLAFYDASRLAAWATFAGGLIFASVLVLGLWYALPLDPLHRDVCAGLALWALLQAFPGDLSVLDQVLGLGREALQRLVYLGMMVAWVRAAWTRESMALSPAAQRVLQPWRLA